ncbi:unnamed protein product [Darwinula stevensoni]|uniref:Alpha-macroglobulin receptor-binding domain-containing protein n=1 Tax=Darwinula stevensoni TaxID=69355 RepID=A0A7R8XEZ2_9CRUS|nr:unnamed protein product [Darwinula stevensoni]CAG0895775.1 unnamed protein product [Darwinula stevensoni]
MNFVVKGLLLSRHFIFDDKDKYRELSLAYDQRQQKNGCFNPRTVLMSRYQGNLKEGERKENSKRGLSAHLFVCLLESGKPLEGKMIQNALRCLKGDPEPSTYTLALITYAFILAGETELGGTQLDMLLQRATEKDGLLFWNASPGGQSMTLPRFWGFHSSHVEFSSLHTNLVTSNAVDTEIASYGILSLLKLNRQGDSARATSAVRWLVTKMNSNGGFTTIQDSVTALHALTQYASQVGLRDVAMDIHLSSSGWEHAFSLTDESRLVEQTISTPSLPFKFHISSASLTYSVLGAPKSHGMQLNVTEKPNDDNGCYRRTIRACATYYGPTNTSNMALLQVSMISGFKPDENAIKEELLSDNSAVIHWEVEKETGEMAVYLNHLDGKSFCLDVPLLRTVAVKNPKPALIKLFDYFAPEVQDTQVGGETNVRKGRFSSLFKLHLSTLRRVGEDSGGARQHRRVGGFSGVHLPTERDGAVLPSTPHCLPILLPRLHSALFYQEKRDPSPISVFNYKQHSLPIRVIVKESESFKVEGEREKSLCLKEQEAEVVTFDLEFLELGEVNVTILARVDSCHPGVCGPNAILLVSILRLLILLESSSTPGVE